MKKINQILRVLMASILVAAGSSICSAQTKLELKTPFPLDKEVRMGKLPNGFTYYIRRNVEPKNRVVMYLANKVGSILETEEQLGLAHFLEHMNFNGTTHYPKNQLVDYLEKSGVRFGADINAYTNFDETVYQLPLPADNPEILKNGLQIMRDWAQEATLEASEIDKERGVILEEKRLRKGATDRMQQKFLPFLLNGSRYAKRIPIGKDEVLQSFKPETIRAFYKDWYRPNLQALIVVGDIDVDSFEKSIKAKFSDLKNPVKEKVRTRYSVELTGKNRYMSVTDNELTSTVAQVMIKSHPTVVRTGEEYRNAMMKSIFNQMLGQRYAELGRQPNPPFMQASAAMSGFIGDLNAFTLTAVARPGVDGLEKAFKAAWRETIRVKQTGFTQAELDRAKTDYANAMDAAYKEMDKNSSENFVKEYLQHFLKGSAAPGMAVEHQFVKTQLPTISLVEMNQKAQEYIKDTDRDILVMAPTKEKETLPDETTMNKWLADVQHETLLPYSEKVNTKPLLAREPVKGEAVSEETPTSLGITTLIMSNGVKVVLKPTTFKNNQVLLSGFAPGGTNSYPDKDFPSAANAANIIGAFGVGNYSNTELGRYLNGKQASVKMSISENAHHISGSSTTTDLPTMLELLYAYFTEPHKDSTQFTGIIARGKASLINRNNDPSSVFQDTIAAVLGNNSIRRTGPTLEKINQIDLNRVFEIYKEQFGDASGFTFTLVGNFKIDSIIGLLEKYIGGLPSSKRQVEVKDLGINIPPGKIAKTVYKGAEAKALVRLYFSGPYMYSNATNIHLDALRNVLAIRLTERLREDEGGIYSPSVMVSYGKIPSSRYTFTISFGCSPKNVEKMISSTLDEIDRLKKSGPAQTNVDKIIAEETRQREVVSQSNEWWLAFINGTLQNREDLETFNSYDQILKAVNPKVLKEAAKIYLKGDNYIRLVLMPETK